MKQSPKKGKPNAKEKRGWMPPKTKWEGVMPWLWKKGSQFPCPHGEFF